MKKFTVEKLRQEMIKISKDWHPAVAKGDQGAGRTLENLLGIDENNISMPDLGNIEIKPDLETEILDDVNWINPILFGIWNTPLITLLFSQLQQS